MLANAGNFDAVNNTLTWTVNFDSLKALENSGDTGPCGGGPVEQLEGPQGETLGVAMTRATFEGYEGRICPWMKGLDAGGHAALGAVVGVVIGAAGVWLLSK